MPTDDRLDDVLTRALAATPDTPPEESVVNALATTRTVGTRKRRLRRTGSGAAVLAPIIILVALFWPSTQPGRIETVSTLTTTTTAQPTTEWTTYDDPANGLAVDVPPGWTASRAPLTPLVRTSPFENVDTAEVMSFGTGNLTYGYSAECNPDTVPVEALGAMQPDDVFVQVLERRARFDEALPARPADLQEAAGPAWTTDCVDPPADLYRLAFSIEGESGFWAPREIGLLVAIGNDADQQTQDELWQSLDQLRFADLADHREALVIEPPELRVSVGPDPSGEGNFLRSPGPLLRLDDAIDAVPFDAYPWFQTQGWYYAGPVDGPQGHPEKRDKRILLVVAEQSPDLLAGSVTADLAEQLAGATDALAFARDGIAGAPGSLPARWRWWSPREGVVAFLGATGFSDDELDAMVASSHWELQRVDPRVSSWQPPFPPTCSGTITAGTGEVEGVPLELALISLVRETYDEWPRGVLSIEITPTGQPGGGVMFRRTVPTPAQLGGPPVVGNVPVVEGSC